jgi:Spy/CpxP family protein refolding chaperone
MFRSGVVLLCAVFFLGGGIVQGEDEGSNELGMRERMTIRMLADRLKLTDEQKTKLENVLKESKKKTETQIRELLTDDQKRSYDEYLADSARRSERMRGFERRWGGRGGDRGGFGGMRGFGDWQRGMGQQIEEIKKRLNLTDDQSEKVQTIMSGIWEEASGKFMEELPKYMGEGGRPDWRKMMSEMSKEFEKYIDKAEKKIKGILKEEQMPEFEKMMGEFRDQMKQWGQRGGRGERRGGRDRGRGNRIDRIMEDLDGSPEEKAIIREKVEAILNAQSEWGEKLRTARRKLSELLRQEGTASEEIQGKLKEVREFQKKYEAALKPLREDLVPILTFEQEAKLVVHRVLE